VKRKTARQWAKQNLQEGDRLRLFSSVAAATDATTVLSPGCYVDIAPSLVFSSVTYVDVDKRANAFFADAQGVREILDEHHGSPDAEVAFIHADYMSDLGLMQNSFDLLVSLYAGFVSEHCTHHLRVGGTLLVNSSHGDAAMASIDPRYELTGVVVSRDGGYSVVRSGLGDYLIPKKPQIVTVEGLHESGRGIGYTTSPFAYLFTRIA
jgi:hypothetical protein